MARHAAGVPNTYWGGLVRKGGKEKRRKEVGEGGPTGLEFWNL